jgi:hypothetical protein
MMRGSKSDELLGRKGYSSEGQTIFFPEKTKTESKNLRRKKKAWEAYPYELQYPSE